MVDGDANNGGNVTEHFCDVCNESPAMTYNEKQGAVCYDCRLYDADGNCVCNLWGCDFCNPVVESDNEKDVPTWKASEVITVDNKWCGCYGCSVERGCRN